MDESREAGHTERAPLEPEVPTAHRAASHPIELHPVPHRQFTERLPRALRPLVSPRLRAIVAQAVWLGLIGAWLERALHFGERLFDGRISHLMIRTNWNHVSLGMAASLIVFTAWLGLALGLDAAARRRHWGRTGLFTSYLGWFLVAFSALQTIESLHDAASIVLAVGIAVRLGPWWDASYRTIIRRTFGPLVGASVVVGVGSLVWVETAPRRALAALPPVARPDAPNVVLLVLDTVRADHLGLYGYHRPTSPRLDALGRAPGAIRFDLARSAAPWTLPSHATMFTGRWPHELSVDVHRPLDGQYPTLAEFLARQGYATAGFVGNTLYCNAWFGLDRGFARYLDAPENQTFSLQEVLRCNGLTESLMTPGCRIGLWPTNGRNANRRTAEAVHQDALDWLDRERPADRPFFLFVNDFDAHDPYLVPAGFPLQFSQMNRSEILASNTRAFQILAAHQRPDASDPEYQAARQEAVTIGQDAYDDCLRYLDHQVGRLIDGLEARGLRRNTWVIITADHGEHFGEHDRFWHGSSLYRPVIDVPLIILPPTEGAAAAAGPSVVGRPVSLRDLPATVADLVGRAETAPFPGRSLRRHWDGSALSAAGEEQPDDPPLSEFRLVPCDEADPFCTAVADDQRIYMRTPARVEELYDTADRAEAVNLAPQSDEAAALERLRALTRKTR